MMKKQIRLFAVLSTAAFLSSMPFTAYAKDAGWTEENGKWYYYDSYGDPLTDTWKKSGDAWYYLDSDGVRASSMQIDEYYVDEDGKRVTMKWVAVENEDFWSGDDEPEMLYYYYGKDGRALTSTWASINGSWYYFNEDSVMETGSIQVDGYNYYLGEDGSRKTGWILMEDAEGNPEDLESWFYFDNSGKRVENEIDKKIDGAYYTFVDGRMQTGWFKLPEEPVTASDSEATPSLPAMSRYRYYDEDGKRASGWRTIEGAAGISEEGELYRFYFKNGAPYYANSGIELFTIDSKKYAFNEKGEMQIGKQSVNIGNGETANYYFGDDGVMKTGKQSIYDEDLGENQNWYFHTDGSKKGQGYHGVKDNTLYVHGLRQEADKDLRFAPVKLDDVSYLVNANGTVQKAGASSKSTAKPELGAGFKDFKDENDTVWTVNVNGIIQ